MLMGMSTDRETNLTDATSTRNDRLTNVVLWGLVVAYVVATILRAILPNINSFHTILLLFPLTLINGMKRYPWIKVKGKRRRIVGKVLMLGRIALKIVATTYATTRPQRTTFVSLTLRVDVASVKFVSLSVLIPMSIYRTVLAAFI